MKLKLSGFSHTSYSDLLFNLNSLFLLQLLNYVVPFLVLLYLTSIMSPSYYGLIATGYSFSQICIVILDYGFGIYGTKLISFYSENKYRSRQIIYSIFCLKFFFFIIIFSFLIFYDYLNNYSLKNLYYFFLLQVLFQGLLPDFFFLGIQKMKYVLKISLFTRFFYVILIFLFIDSDEDYYLVPFFSGVTYFISFLLFVRILNKLEYHFIIPNLKILKLLVIKSFYFFLSRISVVFYSSGSLLILAMNISSYELGLFSIADQFYKFFQTMFSPISQAIYPYFNRTKDINLFKKILFYSIVVFSLISLGSYLIFPFLFKLIFPLDYLNAIKYINYFLIIITINITSTLCGYPLASIFNLEKRANESVIYGFVFYFSLIFLLDYFSLLNGINIILILIFTEIFILFFRIKFILFKIFNIVNHDK
jgi:PST family polysaccharide transporter